MVELAAVYGRYGTPRITAMLRQEGWIVNHKRVERIWREEGLKVPQKQPKTGPIVAERWELRAFASGAEGSRVGIRLRERPYARGCAVEDADAGG
jgi:transposase InsO family protein